MFKITLKKKGWFARWRSDGAIRDILRDYNIHVFRKEDWSASRIKDGKIIREYAMSTWECVSEKHNPRGSDLDFVIADIKAIKVVDDVRVLIEVEDEDDVESE